MERADLVTYSHEQPTDSYYKPRDFNQEPPTIFP
jgi:hypothetical protein